MKKWVVRLSVIAMLLAFFASFVSCAGQIKKGRYSYTECDAEWVDEISGSQKKELAEIKGYESKQDYIDDKTQKVREVFLGSAFVFDSDGTGKFKLADQEESFAWEQDGKQVDISFENDQVSAVFDNTDFEFSSGDLVAKVHDLENEFALTIILTYELK